MSEEIVAWMRKYNLQDLIWIYNNYLNWEHFQYVKILKQMPQFMNNVKSHGKISDFINPKAWKIDYIHMRIVKNYIKEYGFSFEQLLTTHDRLFIDGCTDNLDITERLGDENRIFPSFLQSMNQYQWTLVVDLSIELPLQIMTFLAIDEGYISNAEVFEDYIKAYCKENYVMQVLDGEDPVMDLQIRDIRKYLITRKIPYQANSLGITGNGFHIKFESEVAIPTEDPDGGEDYEELENRPMIFVSKTCPHAQRERLIHDIHDIWLDNCIEPGNRKSSNSSDPVDNSENFRFRIVYTN
jgi:hypothetical protein